MKMTYIKPDIEEVLIKPVLQLAGSSVMYIKQDSEENDEEVSDLRDLL